MAEEKDYTKYPLKVTVLVILMMLGLTFIPPFSIGSVHLKRTNILSDIFTFSGDSLTGKFDDSADSNFLEEMERREAEQAQVATDIGKDIAALTHPRDKKSKVENTEIVVDNTPAYIDGERVVRIEDNFDGVGKSVADFCRLLGTATAKRTVRIAFLGDSYIEGDIITADVRDQLQGLYGGNGVGFVPFSTPLATNRPTVKHTYGGWTNHNLAKKKNAPEEFKDKFFISGVLSIPAEGAWSLFEGTGYRKHSARSSAVRLLFENPGSASIKLTINDSIERIFTPDPSELVQQVRTTGNDIRTVRVDIETPEGFIGYGVSLESNTGVIVDNYSIRGNSGMALFGTSPKINSQVDKLVGYDLIVLQYGLNAMDPNVLDYSSYGDNMRRVVRYIRNSFPDAAVLMLGVGDRSTLVNGEFVTMPAVHSMLKVQRAVAKDCGVAYWDVFTAMGGENSMVGFVDKQWAAKDYTHLSFGGGKYIAKQLVNALLYVKQGGKKPVSAEPQAESGYRPAEPENDNKPTQPNIQDISKTASRPDSSRFKDTVSAKSAPERHKPESENTTALKDTSGKVHAPVKDTGKVAPADVSQTEAGEAGTL